MSTTPKRTPHRMFQVVVLAGVSMGAAEACGSGTSPSPYPDGGVITNPPAPMEILEDPVGNWPDLRAEDHKKWPVRNQSPSLPLMISRSV